MPLSSPVSEPHECPAEHCRGDTAAHVPAIPSARTPESLTEETCRSACPISFDTCPFQRDPGTRTPHGSALLYIPQSSNHPHLLHFHDEISDQGLLVYRTFPIWLFVAFNILCSPH